MRIRGAVRSRRDRASDAPSDGPRPSRPSWRRSTPAGRPCTRSASEGRSVSGGWRRPAILLRDAKRAGQINNVSSIARARRKITGRSHCRPEPLAVRSPSRRPWSRPLPALAAPRPTCRRPSNCGAIPRLPSTNAGNGRRPPVRVEVATLLGGPRGRRCVDLR